MLSHRDEQILNTVAFFRYMTALDIACFLFSLKSISHVREVLTKLVNKNGLYRFMMPDSRIGNKDYVYVRKGTKPLSYSHLLHALTLTRILISMQNNANLGKSLQTRISYEFIGNPGKGINYSVVPDGWVLLERAGRRFPLWIEVDMGSIQQKQFKKQISQRIEFVRSGKYEEVFGEKAVTILYIGSTEERRKTIQKWCMEVLKEQNRESWANVFRFTCVEYRKIFETELF